ncbi:AraC family transcriptional regulator [Bacillus sp. FSL K6-3431]|uniref:AraC family transcriptional regulator n=1 Tax=Bacillus sp. FSL K6-3431 TaxID=2921500 RepID=UPI0030F99E69
MSISSLFQHELLEDNYHAKVNAYYFKQWKAYEMAYHEHKDVEIMYVIDGKCLVKTLTESILLKKGDFILLDSHVPHRLIVDSGQLCRMLNVEFSFIHKESHFPSIKEIANENSALTQFLKIKRSFIVLKDSNEIYHTLKNLVLESDKKEKDKGVMVQLLLAQLLIQIARLGVEDQEVQKENQLVNVYVNQATEFLHYNYDCDIKVSDVGKAVNLHPGYLHRIFKKLIGSTIMEYLTTLRIEKAKMLLKDTEIPIIEIAQYVGINSSQYFSQLFKKHTKKTPIDYRGLFKSDIQKYRES